MAETTMESNKPSHVTETFMSALSYFRSTPALVILIAINLLPERFGTQSFIFQYLNVDDTSPLFVKFLIVGISAGVMQWILAFTANILSNLVTGVPGPRLAKLTILWKLVHSYKGTYKKTLRELHGKHGVIVQVGPCEYSVGNPQHIERCGTLKKAVSPYSLFFQTSPVQKVQTLGEALNMANIFFYEPNIDQCNSDILDALFGYVESGEKVMMADIIARYAYDVLFSTTVGMSPGFLSQQLDITKLREAMEDWKFNAVLHGSYLRFHPIITRLFQLFGWNKSLESEISTYFSIDPNDSHHCVFNYLREASENQQPESKAILEACIALMTSGSDPAITHILTSLYYAYQEPDLVQTLRDEIDGANLSQPPKFKELIHAKPRMPLLHAVLQESLRLCQTSSDAPTYVSGEGGVKIRDKHVPEGCTICWEPSIAHVNPTIFGPNAASFDPTRWLEDRGIARGVRNHMIAFGAGTDVCPGKDLHLSIVAKLFTQIIQNFDLEMASVIASAPVDAAFDDIKDRYYAKVALPKHVAPILASPMSPLRATAPSFAPETTTAPELPPGLTPKKLSFSDYHTENGSYEAVGSYITRVTSATEFVPRSVSTGEGIINGSHDSSKGAVSNSPALSVASTAKSSDISTTPLTWKDEQDLEDLLGRALTNKLINDFDPSTELTPRAPLKTGSINLPRSRYQLHEIVERVWGGRLNHQTDRKDKSMHIWVPGSKVPKWLYFLHKSNQVDNRKDMYNDKSTPGKAAPLPPQKASPIKAERPVNTVWTTFAQDENIRYGKVAAMTSDECNAARRQQDEKRGVKQTEGSEPKMTFKQTFKQTCADATTDDKSGWGRKYVNVELTDSNGNVTALTTGVTGPATAAKETPVIMQKKAAVPPHLRARAASPPHVRAKSPEIGDEVDKKTDSDSENGLWVAAKLPMPCSSD